MRKWELIGRGQSAKGMGRGHGAKGRGGRSKDIAQRAWREEIRRNWSKAENG